MSYPCPRRVAERFVPFRSSDMFAVPARVQNVPALPGSAGGCAAGEPKPTDLDIVHVLRSGSFVVISRSRCFDSVSPHLSAESEPVRPSYRVVR